MIQSNVEIKAASNLAIVHVTGRVERGIIVQLERALAHLLQQGQCRIVLDCTQVTYLSSAAMLLLAEYQEKAQDCGGDIKWLGLKDEFLSMMQWLRDDGTQETLHNRKQALEAFQRVA